MDRLSLPPNPRILIVALRRIGDVLLTTPLVRSLRRAWSDARIEMLVFADTAGILEGNPDVDALLTLPAHGSAAQSMSMAMQMLRRYDLAITTQPGDRPTWFAALAGRKRAGVVENRLIGVLKRMLLSRSIAHVPQRHRVEEMLALARLLGVEACAEVVPPPAAARPDLVPSSPYAVIHAAPMFVYKRWTHEGWRLLAAHLAAAGLTVVATGGPAAAERDYLDEVLSGSPVVRLDGRLSWPELTGLLAGARIYVGPDTSVTHLAAACGCPVVALFGPTDPRIWAPWPKDCVDMTWEPSAQIQKRGNVHLLQHPLPCQPCQEEGCLRRLDSYSLCLDRLPPQQVTAAADTILSGKVSSLH